MIHFEYSIDHLKIEIVRQYFSLLVYKDFVYPIGWNSNMVSYRDLMKFPGEEDLNGAATALIRLQDTYNLRTSSLAAGELNELKYR